MSTCEIYQFETVLDFQRIQQFKRKTQPIHRLGFNVTIHFVISLFNNMVVDRAPQSWFLFDDCVNFLGLTIPS